MKKIYLAGGCFWGVEAYFKQLNGVIDTKVGYINGNDVVPTYEKVCNGTATHAEALQLVYDDKLISLTKILDYFFRIIDPYSLNKQGNDKGVQYRTGIYFDDESIKDEIDNYIQNKFKNKYSLVKTEVELNKGFFIAEEYHQQYLDKNLDGYCHINLTDVNEDDLK